MKYCSCGNKVVDKPKLSDNLHTTTNPKNTHFRNKNLTMGKNFTENQSEILKKAVKDVGLARSNLTPEKLKVSLSLTDMDSGFCSLLGFF